MTPEAAARLKDACCYRPDRYAAEESTRACVALKTAFDTVDPKVVTVLVAGEWPDRCREVFSKEDLVRAVNLAAQDGSQYAALMHLEEYAGGHRAICDLKQSTVQQVKDAAEKLCPSTKER